MIEPTYDNAGNIVLLRIDGRIYTAEAVCELLAYAVRKRESIRRGNQAYEAKNRERRNARRAGYQRERRKAVAS